MRLLKYLGFEGLASALSNASVADVKAAVSKYVGVGSEPTWSPRQWQDFWGDARAQLLPNVTGASMLAPIPRSFFATPDFAQFANELKGIQEVVRWTLYSYRAYPTTGVASLSLFSQDEGAATNQRLDTNMTTGGMLTGNEMFVAVGIGVDPIPSSTDVFAANAIGLVALSEWYNVLQNGYLVLKISGKEYLVLAPLTKLPPGYGLSALATAGAAAATTRNVGTVQSGTPDNQSRYNLDPPLGILPTRPFEVKLNWNTLQTVTTAGRLGANLDGWKVRAAL